MEAMSLLLVSIKLASRIDFFAVKLPTVKAAPSRFRACFKRVVIGPALIGTGQPFDMFSHNLVQAGTQGLSGIVCALDGFFVKRYS
jgi:acyl carrier protein phosphodiesterase